MFILIIAPIFPAAIEAIPTIMPIERTVIKKIIIITRQTMCY
jgi:hypothetical protein